MDGSRTDYGAVPACLMPLAEKRRWVGWRWERRADKKGEVKMTKPPLQANGAYAHNDKPQTWATLGEIEAASATQHFEGVGLQLLDLKGFAGLDLDKVRDPATGEVLTWAGVVIACGSYAEVTPSGTGLRVIGRVSKDHPPMHSKHKHPDGGEIEFYVNTDTGRYITVSGDKIDAAPDALIPIDDLVATLFATVKNPPGKAGNGAGGFDFNLGDFEALPEWLRTCISHGQSGDQSADFQSAVNGLCARKWTFEDALKLFEQHPNGPAGKYKGRLEKELRRSWEKASASQSKKQEEPQKGEKGAGVGIDDFVAFMPTHSYIFMPLGDFWPSTSVNARVPSPACRKDGTPISASTWLDRNRPVEQTTWAPGEPALIDGRLISDGGWITRPGCTVFNSYRPPTMAPRAGPVDPWLDHIRAVFPDDADHIVKWLAQRVQHPEIKINHALVLGGAQGIGKDSIIEPVKRAIGPWNCSEVSPQQVLGRFNGFLKSVILRISEAHDLGEVDRFAFYEHMKAYTAAPPDVLRVDEKHLRESSILNVCGIVLTTNHKTDGIFLPPDDRRHFVAWSERAITDFDEVYWRRLYSWFDNGGAEAVAYHLHTLSLTDFDPKAPPPKTDAFWAIVDASRAPENAEMADALDRLGRPDAVTLAAVVSAADAPLAEWLGDRRNARKAPHRMEEVGYVPVRNRDALDGLWSLSKRRQVIYARREFTPERRRVSAESMAEAGR